MPSMLKRAFTDHPASVGESYFEHMGMAFGFAGRMIGAGFCCAVHGLFPFAFKHSGSACIENLHRRMVVNRDGGANADKRSMPPLAGGAGDFRAAE